MLKEELTDDYAKTVCKIGQGNACCRYLTISGEGWGCEKHTSFKAYLDSRVANNSITAQGDNCKGIS